MTWYYTVYALCAVALTVGLAFTLHRHGKVFLTELFPENVRIAKAINSLLVTGFFMLNTGYAFLISRTEATTDQFVATENLIQRLGVLLLSLGVIHFINMAVFWKIRRNITETTGVPVPYNTMVPPPPKPAEAAFTAATF